MVANKKQENKKKEILIKQRLAMTADHSVRIWMKGEKGRRMKQKAS